MTWKGLAHDRHELTSCGECALGDERVVGPDDRRVHAMARFDFRAAGRDDVQLERFHAIGWRPRSARRPHPNRCRGALGRARNLIADARREGPTVRRETRRAVPRRSPDVGALNGPPT